MTLFIAAWSLGLMVGFLALMHRGLVQLGLTRPYRPWRKWKWDRIGTAASLVVLGGCAWWMGTLV